jgi:hypothetical protein
MLLWILLGALYRAALFALGLATLRKGHTVLFWVGIFLPFLWIVGALDRPCAHRAGREHPSTVIA